MLAGFSATNHPQQTAKRGANDAVDDRGTTPAFIASLEARFGKFDMDVAAAAHNAKAPTFYTREDDGLSLPWRGNVWCNPPYSQVRKVVCPAHDLDPEAEVDDCECSPARDLGSWVGKAWDEWSGVNFRPTEHIITPRLIVMLVPANRCEQAWWQDHVEPFRDCGTDLRIEFLRGRMRFDRPQAVIGPKGDRPPFGCALLIWGGPR